MYLYYVNTDYKLAEAYYKPALDFLFKMYFQKAKDVLRKFDILN